MKLTYLLAFVTVAIFIGLVFFNKRPRRFYISFVFFLFPLMDLPITPAEWGSFKVFDGISYISFFILFKDFKHIGKRSGTYVLLLGVLIISLLIGSLNSDNVRNSLIHILSIFPIFIYSRTLIYECSINEEFQKNIIWLLKFIAIVSIIFLVVQLFVGLDFTFYSELNRNTEVDSGLRYPSFFSEPQKFGHFLAMLSFIFLINEKQIQIPATKNYLLFGLMILGIISTGGRSAFMGLFAGIIFLFILLGYQFRTIIISIFLIGSIIILNFFNSLVVLNRSQEFDRDFSFRASLWDEAYTIYKSHPLFGIGIGNFKNYAIAHSNNYFINTENEVIFFDQPESGYLMILTETGTLGFLISFFFIISPVYTKCKNYFKGKKELKSFFFIAAILSWMVSFVSLYSLYDKRILIVLITLVCLLMLKRKSKPDYEL